MRRAMLLYRHTTGLGGTAVNAICSASQNVAAELNVCEAARSPMATNVRLDLYPHFEVATLRCSEVHTLCAQPGSRGTRIVDWSTVLLKEASPINTAGVKK